MYLKLDSAESATTTARREGLCQDSLCSNWGLVKDLLLGTSQLDYQNISHSSGVSVMLFSGSAKHRSHLTTTGHQIML